MLSYAEARAFYDRFGARQDKQIWYEGPAVDNLIAHATFDAARMVFEFGCGTGRVAQSLLRDTLPPTAGYLGMDVSSTMIRLARNRLLPYAERATVCLTSGAMQLPVADGACDRFLSTYVLDLLSEVDIRAVIAEAHRILEPGGLLCLAGLGHGASPFAQLVEIIWTTVHTLSPARVGGCRPIALLNFVPASHWRVHHHRRIETYGLTSDVIVAQKPDDHL